MRHTFTSTRLAKLRSLIIPRLVSINSNPWTLLMEVKIDPNPLENNLELSCKIEFMQTSWLRYSPSRYFWKIFFKNSVYGTSLGAQWFRICLPMQRTLVWSLVQGDPTCRGATKPMCHNYWACTPEPASHNYWARVPQLLQPARLEPMLCNKRSHCNEKPTHRNEE